MDDKPYCVHVVIDPDYGEQIRDLPFDEPAWIIGSTVNQPVIHELLTERQGQSHLDGITSFCGGPDSMPPEDCLLALVDTIDLHHGEYSHDPPYSVLHVIGVKWSEHIRSELEAFGFILLDLTLDGFVAKRDDLPHVDPE